MYGKKCICVVLGLVALLLFSAIAFFNISGENGESAVTFTKQINDLEDDVEGEAYTEIEDDADILTVQSSLDGDNIVLEMTVKGLIDYDINSGNRRYYFYLDIDSDGYPDWQVTLASSVDDAALENNKDFEDDDYIEYKLTSENFEGQGTDTFKIWFPKYYITDNEAITTWDLSGETNHDDGEGWAKDYAPDNTFSDRWGDEPPPDPATETPTDTSISVAITSLTYSMEEQGDKISVDIYIKGTTSGVDHCGFTFVDYYKDGTYSEYAWTNNEFDMEDYPEEEQQDMKDKGFIEYYFKSTSDNWKTWEYRMSGVIDNSEGGFSAYEISESVIYARGYKDTDETLWNQAAEDIPIADGGDGDGDGETPTGTMLGPFMSKDNKPISGASVKVNTKTRGSYSSITDADGYATFAEEIPAGDYTCTVEKADKTLIESDLTLSMDGTPTYDGASTPPASSYSASEIQGDDVDGEDKKKDDKGFLPGFEVVYLFAALIGVLIITRRRWK